MCREHRTSTCYCSAVTPAYQTIWWLYISDYTSTLSCEGGGTAGRKRHLRYCMCRRAMLSICWSGFVLSPSCCCCCVFWVVTERSRQGVWRRSERKMRAVIHEGLGIEPLLCRDERIEPVGVVCGHGLFGRVLASNDTRGRDNETRAPQEHIHEPTLWSAAVLVEN